jgi:hypothetical protein
LNKVRHVTFVIALFIVGLTLFVPSVIHAASTPTATFDPSSGIPGTLVTVSLSGFDGSDTSCTIAGTPVYNPTSCSLSSGSGTLTFTVKQYTPAGSYTISVTGNQKSDSVQTSFQVNGLSFTLSPTSGAVGTDVSFTMTNVPTNDTSCSLSSQPSGVVTLSGCVVSNGSGSGTFVVGQGSPGDYVIEVTACTGNNGCGPSAGDFAQQVFTLTAGPTVTLNPSSGLPGADVAVSGTGFKLSDQSCSISSPTNPTVVQNSACAIASGTETVQGSFVVGNVPKGQYVIEVTGCPGNNGCSPSQGDFAQAVFQDQQPPIPTITISPTGAIAGVTVQVSGTGFSPSDTSCSISGGAVGNAICSISGGTLSGSFVVQSVATGYYTITAQGSTGDSASANLDYYYVTPTQAPAVPGFPVEAILTGVFLGFVAVASLRRYKNVS